MHCAGEDSSARIGEDGIKKCRTGVSPFSPEKTMEEVSTGFGVLFFTASEPDDEDFVLYRLLKPPKDASYEVSRICE